MKSKLECDPAEYKSQIEYIICRAQQLAISNIVQKDDLKEILDILSAPARAINSNNIQRVYQEECVPLK